MFRPIGFVCTLGIACAVTFAEEQTVEVVASASGRLYADYTFGDCCDLDSFVGNTSAITTKNCGTIGGYCSDGRSVANWVFELPELPVGAELLSVRFTVNRQSGSSGSGTLYLKESESGTLGTSSASQVYFNPSHAQSVYFTGSMAHSFEIPLGAFESAGSLPYLRVAIYRSGALSLMNSGASAPTLELTFDAGPRCDGDVNDDGAVDGTDLAQILAYWGQVSDARDLDGDGIVGPADLTIVLAGWGACTR
ncbi:MAG: hypothetical protein VX641_04250 [Planctomycetota bacterium]|nr:hypothetical protein [Planctomycetota bacterium]